jgi:hypothetical protein
MVRAVVLVRAALHAVMATQTVPEVLRPLPMQRAYLSRNHYPCNMSSHLYASTFSARLSSRHTTLYGVQHTYKTC